MTIKTPRHLITSASRQLARKMAFSREIAREKRVSPEKYLLAIEREEMMKVRLR